MKIRSMSAIEQAAATPSIVHESTLDEQSLDRLFSEIAEAGSPQVFFRDGRPHSLKTIAGDDLAVAREALRRQATRGVQLRYRGRDAEHWDTLTPDVSGSARLVRLRFAA
jgi:hypothetical protein